MAELPPQLRWKIAGALVGSGLLSWISALALTRVGAAALALPEGAALVALEAAPTEAPRPRDPGAAPEAGEAPTPAAGEAAEERPKLRSFEQFNDPIVHRSLFDSAKAGGPAVDPAAASEVTGEERKSDLPVVLLATMVAEPEEHSSALIAEEKGAGAMGYGIGDQLLGEAKIIRIEPRKVFVQRESGAVEYISMEGGTYTKEGSGGEGAPKKGKAEDDEDGVTKDGPNKFIVEQALVDKIMANPEELYSQVRAVPHKGPGGEVDGYRLSGIRRRSVFNKLGIKNGDVIHTVNGKPLDSMANAMDAYQSLGAQRSFTFEVSRKNERQNFEYEIR